MADELSEVVEDIFEGFDTDVEDEPEAQETEESAEDLDALRKEVKALRQANAERAAREMAAKVESARQKFLATVPDNFKGVAAVALAGSETLKTLKRNIDAVQALIKQAAPPETPKGETSAEEASAEEDNGAFSPPAEGNVSIPSQEQKRHEDNWKLICENADPRALLDELREHSPLINEVLGSR
jgi:hypothetical protein